MSWFPARQVYDGDKSIFQKLRLSSLLISGTPDGTKFLRDDGSWATPGGGGGGYLGAVASQSAMLAQSSAVVGQSCYRTDVPGFYELVNSPPSTLANWVPFFPSAIVVEYTTTQTAIAVPAGITGLIIEYMVGPGPGGASGRRGASGTVCCGGGGGGSPGIVGNYRIPAALLGSTFTLTLPAAGAGGAAVTADSTDGNPGTAPGVASFASGSLLVSTFTGTAAHGGTNALGTGGVGGSGMFNGSSGAAASTSGGVGNPGVATTNGAPSGAGSGGGIATTPAAVNGGNGGFQLLNYLTQAAGGVAGGAAPGTGAAATAGIGGQGAAGGASSITGAAQAGADATGYGAPGGGGGASLNGNNSGRGGNGGPPYCRLRWVFV